MIRGEERVNEGEAFQVGPKQKHAVALLHPIKEVLQANPPRFVFPGKPYGFIGYGGGRGLRNVAVPFAYISKPGGVGTRVFALKVGQERYHDGVK